MPLPRELSAGKYQLQMRAYYSEGEYTKWIDAVTFESKEKEVLEAFPNPVGESLNLQYQSVTEEEVRIELIDYTTGRRIFSPRRRERVATTGTFFYLRTHSFKITFSNQ